mmetsp:Transcript_33781/g.46776  ORF Transcript_33781/g.46776 Transcript_33781/m.46776 type:complete len:350 (+) Transcript_33781:99-1148(+)|eukprot:CAMPEP_0196594870 /NCGR_PEP_ID=MMETSP1081-20130531/79486_1 /TAXON_ID=36882 /ORGANISM="Pyramimonas amylifera, Strain CCMP720" /LENGTH=349 /DNA_ID=CAMNT_0041919247 /DNA_START=76 /DNA_END=1125 /DNA_ORIENTATION=+
MSAVNITASRRVERISAHFNDSKVDIVLGDSSTSRPRFTVALLGAAGGIGQPLAMLLKMSPLISELRLYDIVNTPGVAADLSHIDSPCKVMGYVGSESLGAALAGADVVVIPAGVPRKPGMTRDDLFNTNASIVKTLAQGVALHCPRAVVNVISNPVNSTVPIVAEVMRKAGVYDPARLMGVTSLDVLRANTFLAEAKGLRPGQVDVPVFGGHAGATILPIFSQSSPEFQLSEDELANLTNRVQNGGTEVVDAKAGLGSATLSMAVAASRCAEACMRALGGEQGVIICAFVPSTLTSAPFFASRVVLGKQGVQSHFPLGALSPVEKNGLEALLPELKSNIEKGIAFAKK